MRGDKESDALARKLEQQIPQLAPRHRVNARRRLVEEEHTRLVHQRTSHRKPLSPAMVARPSDGSSSPHNIRMTVDLPEPLGPRKPKMLPLATENVTPSTAVKCPNRLVRFSQWITAMPTVRSALHVLRRVESP